jgi:hypothetical protein
VFTSSVVVAAEFYIDGSNSSFVSVELLVVTVDWIPEFVGNRTAEMM